MNRGKRNLFLNKLEKSYKRFNEFETNFGSGFKRVIKRLISYPDIYIPYILIKLGLPLKRKQKIKVFNKDVEVSIVKNNFGALLLLSKFGCLPNLAEYKLSKFLIKHLNENDVFYDIGANYGYYTYLAAEFCKEVHSFEPLPNMYKSLVNSCSIYKKCFLNQIALSNSNGFAHLSVAGENSSIVDKVKKKIKKSKLELSL